MDVLTWFVIGLISTVLVLASVFIFNRVIAGDVFGCIPNGITAASLLVSWLPILQVAVMVSFTAMIVVAIIMALAYEKSDWYIKSTPLFYKERKNDHN